MPVAFRAERKRFQHLLRPGEVILASDLLAGIMPILTALPPVLVVSDQAVYVVLSGRDKAEVRIRFDEVLTMRRGRRAITLVLRDNENEEGTELTCVPNPRDHRFRTAALIAERVPVIDAE